MMNLTQLALILLESSEEGESMLRAYGPTIFGGIVGALVTLVYVKYRRGKK